MLTLSATKPTRTGYDFLGWSTVATATTAAYQPSASFTSNAVTVLYAVWKAIPVPATDIVSNGVYVIRNSGLGNCLSAGSISFSGSGSVSVMQYFASASQLWRIEKTGDNEYIIWCNRLSEYDEHSYPNGDTTYYTQNGLRALKSDLLSAASVNVEQGLPSQRFGILKEGEKYYLSPRNGLGDNYVLGGSLNLENRSIVSSESLKWELELVGYGNCVKSSIYRQRLQCRIR